MRVGVLDKVKYKAKEYVIVAEWDDNTHVDLELDGKKVEGVKRSDLEYISGSHV